MTKKKKPREQEIPFDELMPIEKAVEVTFPHATGFHLTYARRARAARWRRRKPARWRGGPFGG